MFMVNSRSLMHRFVPALAVFLMQFVLSCSVKSVKSEHVPKEAGRLVTAPQPLSTPQAQNLESLLMTEFEEAVRPSFELAFATQNQLESKSLSAWAAKGFSLAAVNALSAEGKQPCLLKIEEEAAFASCVWADARSSATESDQWLQGITEKGALAMQRSSAFSKIKNVQFAQIQIWILESGELPKILKQLEKLAKNQSRSIELLLRRSVIADAPFIAESFFNKRKFVFTTSLAQASFGRERMYNLANHMVRLQVSSGKLVIIRDGSDLNGSGNFVDIIETSYPILQTLQDKGETYYQVDFSSPQNKQFLVQPLVGSVPQMSLSADVVVPKVSFVSKETLKTLGSALYVNKSDQQMVIDNLVLVNGSDEVLSTDPVVPEQLLDKDTVRPTVRVFQGLFAFNENSENFAKTQAISLPDSFNSLRQNGADDTLSRNPGQDFPFFEAGGRLLDDGGRDRQFLQMARKFDVSKPIVWVLSANTPVKAVPVLKAAVLSFQPIFEKMAKEGSPKAKLVALTQQEFLASTEAAALGFSVGDAISAADPRVNMILWDESKSLGAAWATAVAAPTTGEVISADVMLSGTMWAKEGCLGYLKSQWSLDKESNATKRKKGHVPSGGSRMMWEISCETALLTLGFYRSSDELNVLNDEQVSKVTALTRLGDNESLEQMLRGFDPKKKTAAAALSGADLKAKIIGTLPAALVRTTSFQTVSDVLEASLRPATEALEKHNLPRYFAQSGASTINSSVDCYLPVGLGFETQLSGIGAPIMDSALVKGTQEGALALLRSTLIHELGHAFGLRHNFAGSLQSAKLKADAIPLVVPYAKTDSFMDYNDYSYDLEMGSMVDYTSSEGGLSVPSFGAYDLLALSALYNLDSGSLKFDISPQFCSDRNVGLVNDCQRYDWGKNYVEFLIHDANMQLSRIANVQSPDLILFDVNTLIGRPLGRLLEDLNKLTSVFATAQSSVKSSTQLDQKRFFFDLAELSFRAQKAKDAFSQTQPYLKSFEGRMGRPLMGVFDFADLPQSIFDEPVFAEILGGIIREQVAFNLLSAGNAVKAAARDAGEDVGFLGAYENVKMGTVESSYLSELLKLFAGRVVKSPGEPLKFVYFLSGSVKDGSLAKLNGEPVVLSLKTPFFNHILSKQVVSEIEIDNPDATVGGTLKLPAVARGEHSLSQMVVNLAAASSLSGGYEQSPSYERLLKDSSYLKKQMTAYTKCQKEADKSSVAGGCTQMTEDLFPMASVALKFYNEALGIAGNP